MRCRFEGGYWQNVFAEESKFTGCDFNETVFKDTGVSAVFAAICQSERELLRQVILDETRLTDSELSECKGSFTAASGGFNRDELL